MIRWLLIFLMLGGCASQPVVVRPAQYKSVSFAMNGRISVQHKGVRDSAGLRWVHEAQTDEILLLTPLGQTAARIYCDEGLATLDNGDKHYSDKDVESLMMQVLGWRLQLNSLHQWVLGLPAEGPVQLERDELGRIAQLKQEGWEVRYLGFADDRTDSLPKRLQLIRDNLQITLLVDEWEWNVK